MKYDDLPDLERPKRAKTTYSDRYGDDRGEPSSPSVEPEVLPAAATVLCAIALAAALFSVLLHPHVIGRPDRSDLEWRNEPMTMVQVSVDPRTIDGRRRMPTWSELFEQYRLGDSVRKASLAWYNARRKLAEPEATPGSSIPEGATVVIILGENRERPPASMSR